MMMVFCRIFLAAAFAGNRMTLAYLPFLMVSGCLAGAFTGGCAQLVIHRIDLRQASDSGTD